MQQAKLVYNPGTPEEQEFPFVEQIEIGRSRGDEGSRPGRVVFSDPRISSRHCIVTQTADGRFFVRDLSRNGTRVDGKRLIPNLEFELQPGATITVGLYTTLSLSAAGNESGAADRPRLEDSTILASGLSFVTILVGDIRGYTTLNQLEDSSEVSRCVRALFSELEGLVPAHGGSVKEYQGDALFAFWEEIPDDPQRHAISACEAALALNEKVGELTKRPDVWTFPNHPLNVDWALTTGAVVISSFGGVRPTGLSMVGDAVNLAFRLEKLADEDTGTVLACKNTQALAGGVFVFDDLGEHSVSGRQGLERVYALRSSR